MTSKVDVTLFFYGPMLRTLEAAGCMTYVTGSALVPGAMPRDLDIVVECPREWNRFRLESFVKPFGFKDIDAREGYEADAASTATLPEDHESDHGIYQAPAIGSADLTAPDILPVQLLIFTRGSVAAGHWRKATRKLRDNPDAYRSRDARVRMFRICRGQPVENVV